MTPDLKPPRRSWSDEKWELAVSFALFAAMLCALAFGAPDCERKAVQETVFVLPEVR